MLAYVMISLRNGHEQDVVSELRKLSHVKDIHIVFGEWDIIALLDVVSPEHLSTLVLERIRSMPDVELTSTMIVAK